MTDVSATTLRLLMLDISPSAVASWPTPNYINPETRGPELWIVSGIFFFVATVSVWTRLYSRCFIRHWFGLDDWLILVAYVRSQWYVWRFKSLTDHDLDFYSRCNCLRISWE
jgi:hypothetical protein